MPRVVPSQVRAYIGTLPDHTIYPEAASLNHLGSAALSSILDLLGQIPDELLTMDATAYSSFIGAKGEIRDTLEVWTAQRNAGHTPVARTYHISRDPVGIIRDALAKCPDESPAPATSELNFINDPALRTNLRNDIGAINRTLSNGEWKAATVLAGSAIEALLLWKLQQIPKANIDAAIKALTGSGELKTKPKPNLEDWVLHDYAEVAAHLKTIKQDTATETRLAREFRNLIHPGRAQRLAQNCDRGTALSCVAALEHVVRDLT